MFLGDKLFSLRDMNTFFRVALFATLCAIGCRAQTATVTFYSPGFSIKSEGAAVLLLKSEQPFGGVQGGWLFDGTQRLARIRAGSFVILRLNSGEHTFTDKGPTGPSEKPLVINMKNDGQYCVRLFAKMHVEWQNQIEEVPCQKALHDTAHLKPVEIKRVDPVVRAQVDTAKMYPTASPENH